MKKSMLYVFRTVLVFSLIFIMVGCTTKDNKQVKSTGSSSVKQEQKSSKEGNNVDRHSTSDNSSAEALLKKDNDTDLLVYKKVAYVNAVTVDWVSELHLESDKKLGDIKRTNVTKQFQDFDATLLDVGTEVYSAKGRADIVLADINNMLVPYLAYVEG